MEEGGGGEELPLVLGLPQCSITCSPWSTDRPEFHSGNAPNGRGGQGSVQAGAGYRAEEGLDRRGVVHFVAAHENGRERAPEPGTP